MCLSACPLSCLLSKWQVSFGPNVGVIWSINTGISGQDAVSGLTPKQHELLVQCKLKLRLLDPAFLEAAGPDKKSALIRTLEVGTAA